MLKAVRLHIRQQMPNYRKPASFLIKETFPLPPYSSVIGMVHTACGWTKENQYHPMRIGVQGSYAGTVSDYATNYVFEITYDPARHQAKVETSPGKYDGINIGPKSYELLTDVELILHIVPDDQSLVETIREKLWNPPVFLSLGRHEDIVRIDSADIVALEPAPESMAADNDIYIPVKDIPEEHHNMMGTIYRIHKVYSIDHSDKRKPMRYWSETVLVQHVCRGTLVESPAMLTDSRFHDMVFLA